MKSQIKTNRTDGLFLLFIKFTLFLLFYIKLAENGIFTGLKKSNRVITISLDNTNFSIDRKHFEYLI